MFQINEKVDYIVVGSYNVIRFFSVNILIGVMLCKYNEISLKRKEYSVKIFKQVDLWRRNLCCKGKDSFSQQN